jgi:hypothetical protein
VGELKDVVDRWQVGELSATQLGQKALELDAAKGIALLKLAKARDMVVFMRQFADKDVVSNDMMVALVRRCEKYMGISMYRIGKGNITSPEIEKFMEENR